MWAALLGALQAIPSVVGLGNQFISLITRAITAYEAHVKVLWAQSVQAGLQPLQQGQPTTDEQKQTAAKAVADAIAKMPT